MCGKRKSIAFILNRGANNILEYPVAKRERRFKLLVSSNLIYSLIRDVYVCIFE